MKMKFVVLGMTLLMATGCTQYTQVEKPKDDPKVQEVLNATLGKDASEMEVEIARLEDDLQKFFEVAEWVSAAVGYQVKGSNYGAVRTLVGRLNTSHKALVLFTADPDKNPSGRFTVAISLVSGAIGDVERNMIGIKSYGDDWVLEAELLEDSRRLYNQVQILRADLVNFAKSKPTPVKK